jgi:PhnB protein
MTEQTEQTTEQTTTQPAGSLVTGVTARLVAADASAAIAFYVRAFGAEERERFTGPDGRIVHAEIRIGGVPVAIKDEGDGDPSPTTLGGSPVILALRVTDADAVADRMTEAGGTVVYPVHDAPYGERGGRLADPFGHLWMISQRTEDLSPGEIQRRTGATRA